MRTTGGGRAATHASASTSGSSGSSSSSKALAAAAMLQRAHAPARCAAAPCRQRQIPAFRGRRSSTTLGAAGGASGGAGPAGASGGAGPATTAAASVGAQPSGLGPGERLTAWVMQHTQPKGRLPTKAVPMQTDAGWRLMATEPVKAGQVLVRVPRALFMDGSTARSCPLIGSLVSQAQLSEWHALLLHLLVERARGADSFWAPYIAILPDQSGHPLLWGADSVALLEPSPLAHTLRLRQAQVVSDTALLTDAGANDLPIAGLHRQRTGEDLVSVASVGWAAATLLSRSYSLDLAEEEPLEGDMSYFGSWSQHTAEASTLALVPWADLLVHSADAGSGAVLQYQPELRCASLAAHRPYGPGEALKDSHGPSLAPGDLALDYGYVPRAVLADVLHPAGSSGGHHTHPQQQGHGPASSSGSHDPIDTRDMVDAPHPHAGAGGAAPSAHSTASAGSSADLPASAGGGEARRARPRRAPRHRVDVDARAALPPRSRMNDALLAALAGLQGAAPAPGAAPPADGPAGPMLALGARGPDAASLAVCRAALGSDAELVRAGWRLKAGPQDVDLAARVLGSLAAPSSVGPATEAAALAALGAWVGRALGRYADDATLKARLGDGSARDATPADRAGALAAAVHLSEVAALRGSAAVLAEWQAALASGVPAEEVYAGYYDEEDEGEEGGDDDGMGEGEAEDGSEGWP